jgi:hypothetical protein
MAILHIYQAAWCAFFLMEYEEAARYLKQLLNPILIRKEKKTGKLTLLLEEAGTAAAGSAGAAGAAAAAAASASAAAASSEDVEILSIPPSRASAQAFYAFHAGLCYALLGRFGDADPFFRSAPQYLQDKKIKPKPIDLFAKHKSEEFLARNAARAAAASGGAAPRNALSDEVAGALYFLDFCELIFVWGGLSQIPSDMLTRIHAQCVRTKTRIAAAVRPEHLAQAMIYCAVVQRGLGQQRDALLTLQEVVRLYLPLLEKTAALSATLAYLAHELCALSLSYSGDLKAAQQWLSKAQACKGYDLYNGMQTKLYALSGSLQEALKQQQAGLTRRNSGSAAPS